MVLISTLAAGSAPRIPCPVVGEKNVEVSPLIRP
jgi:hypothetical protein